MRKHTDVSDEDHNRHGYEQVRDDTAAHDHLA
jgi:hypothetical protein